MQCSLDESTSTWQRQPLKPQCEWIWEMWEKFILFNLPSPPITDQFMDTFYQIYSEIWPNYLPGKISFYNFTSSSPHIAQQRMENGHKYQSKIIKNIIIKWMKLRKYSKCLDFNLGIPGFMRMFEEIQNYEYLESNRMSMPFLSQDFGFELTFNLI